MALGPTFDDVLSAAGEGAEWAWRVIYEDLAPSLRGYLRARTGEAADDVLGDVFLDLARRLPHFEGDEQGFRAWVFTVAHHRVVDEWRRSGRRKAVATEPGRLVGLAGSGGDVEEQAIGALSIDAITSLIEHLTEDQQAVVLLRIVGDLSLEQVATIMKKRVGSVKALQHRAFANLRKNLPEAVSP
ncbi:MAG: RNA polymerase sigma factor [Acidimicrobiia bacterium]